MKKNIFRQGILKKFNVTVTKSDRETGTAQGDASLAGAAYGIYKGDQLVDTYYTDENGQFTTGYYVCGDDWTIREISPSEGYLLDSTVYAAGAEAANYTVELNAAPAVAVAEQVQKGNIAIIKHSDNGDTQIEIPEEGAVFAVYLKAAGSYEAAKDTERDYLTCDENGFALSKDLPYGVYTVHQVSGWEGRELMSDFDVFIAKDGETYRYLINNANFESFIHCHHKQPLCMGGTDKYMNLVIIHRDIHRLVHTTNPSTIAMYMNLFQLDKKALEKLNTLRVLAGQPEI